MYVQKLTVKWSILLTLGDAIQAKIEQEKLCTHIKLRLRESLQAKKKKEVEDIIIADIVHCLD